MNKADLIKQAEAARQFAYAPYSQFAVGAAVLTAAGNVFTGCNVENSSYSLSICAERTALFKAVSRARSPDERTIVALAVVADTADPISPCGACRQVLAEFGTKNMPVYLANLNGVFMEYTFDQLFPAPFDFDRDSKARG